MSSLPSDPAPSAEQARWFAEEVHSHEPLLRNYLRGAFRDIRDVDDVVQESYLRVWKVRTAQPIRSAKAFLFQVARHIAVDFLRRESNSPVRGVADFHVLRVPDARPGVPEIACAREEAALLARALHALPPSCREIVILRKLKGVSQKEIADRLGLSQNTVQNQVFRGVKRCERFLAAHGVLGLFEDESR